MGCKHGCGERAREQLPLPLRSLTAPTTPACGTAPSCPAVARSMTTGEAKAALAAAAEAEAAKSIKGSAIAKVAFACVLLTLPWLLLM